MVKDLVVIGDKIYGYDEEKRKVVRAKVIGSYNVAVPEDARKIVMSNRYFRVGPEQK